MQGDWPPPWELTAPESHVLSYRGGAWRGEPVRLAVAELVARGALRLEQAGQGWALTGSASTRAVQPPLDAVLELVREARHRPLENAREGVLVKDLKRAVRKRFRPIEVYHQRHVAPALVQRGLLRATEEIGRRGVAELDWTAAGREADVQLSRWLELGREHLPGWVESDPVRARRFVREAGSALLLMRDSMSVLAKLRDRADPDAPTVELHPSDSDGALDLDGLIDFGGGLDLGGIGDFGGSGGGADGGGGN